MRVLALLAVVVAFGACGSDDDDAGSTSAGTTAETKAETTPTAPAGRFAVGKDRHELALDCMGTGTPTIILEAGTDSSAVADLAPIEAALAERTTTCTYDRAGTGTSDPPTAARRTLDDVVADLHGLIAAAKLEGPYLLAGQSGGGNVAIHYAGRHPENVAGVVLIDTPAPVDDLAKEFPGSQAWANPEHVDWVAAERLQHRRAPRIGDAKLVILTASDGQSSAKDQRFWLRLARGGKQRTLEGGHDLHEDNPDAVVAELEKALDAVDG